MHVFGKKKNPGKSHVDNANSAHNDPRLGIELTLFNYSTTSKFVYLSRNYNIFSIIITFLIVKDYPVFIVL